MVVTTHTDCFYCTGAAKGHRERETGLERQLREVQSQLEHQEADARRREWSHSDALQEKEREIER